MKRVYFAVPILIATLVACSSWFVKRDDSQWVVAGRDPFITSPVPFGDAVLAVDFQGMLYCVRPGDGKVLWRHPVGERVIFSPLVAGDGSIYVHTGVDSIVRLEISADGSARQVWSTADLPGETSRTPSDRMVLAGAYIYRVNTTYNDLTVYDSALGTQLYKYSGLSAPSADNPKTYTGMIALPNNDFDLILTFANGLHETYKDGEKNGSFTFKFVPDPDDPEPHLSYQRLGSPFLYLGKARLFLLVIDQTNFTRRARLFTIDPGDPDGMVPATDINFEADSPDSLGYSYGFRGWQYGDYYEYIDNYAGIVRFNMANKTVSVHPLPDSLPGGLQVRQIFEVFPARSGDLYVQIEVSRDSPGLIETGWFFYRFLDFYSAVPASAVRLYPLINNVLAPALMLDDLFVVPYADNTLRAYSVSDEPLIGRGAGNVY